MHRDNATIESPVLWYLHGTVKNTAEDELTKVFRDDLGDITDYECEVEVPQYSQMIRSPNIGGVICNPTTTAMLLNSVSAMEGQPLNVLPEEIAMGCYDFRATNFGSWSFVVATAGTYGYKSYVEYSTIEGIKRHLKNGYAVGCSVHYSNDPTKSDYLENAYGSTGGHLIVLRGYTEIDGVEYFISNDAFNPSNDTVRKLYRIDQFVNCWINNTIYVVKPGKVQGVGKYPVERVHCDLVEVEPDKYALVSESTQSVTPYSEANSRHGFIVHYRTRGIHRCQPIYLRLHQHERYPRWADPLSYDQLSDEDFKLYVANNNDHPGKLFIVDNQSDINLLVLATVSATEYIVTEDEIKPNTSGITAGTTTVAEFLANLTPAKLATMKLFSASDVVESAADFLATDGKTAGDTIDEGDFLAVLAWDNQTLGKYDIVTGPALEPLYLSFDFTGKELQDGVVTLYIHDFPFESPLEGLPGDYSGDITWTSSNPNLVPVDENGILLEPYNRTTVTITANVPTDGKYQAATISYQVTIGCLTLNSFHWGTINHPVIGEEPSSVFVQHPDDKAQDGTPYKLFWINGGYPKFTWSGTLDENGKFKAGEQYTLQIEFWTNEFEGGNSGYLYKTGFGAADVIGLPPVGTAVGDTSITGVTVNRINSYRVTVTFEYAPLKFKVLGYYSDETCTVDLTTTTPVTLGTTKEDALAALPAAGYAKLSDGTALAIDIAWSFVEDSMIGTAGTCGYGWDHQARWRSWMTSLSWS